VSDVSDKHSDMIGGSSLTLRTT